MPGPDSALRMLGLAARAGALVTGTQHVREAVRAGSVRLVLLATDSSDNSREKLVPLLDARRVAYLAVSDRGTLGAAVGKGPLSAVGITVQSFADRIRTELGRDSDGAV